MERRVVITGMGIWSCLGTDLDTVKDSLYKGKSGIGIEPARLEYGYRSALTGIVPEPVITKQMLDRHTRAGMSEEAKYAYMASKQAFDQASTTPTCVRTRWAASSATTHRLSQSSRLRKSWTRSTTRRCWVMDSSSSR